jgi:hypothetical protein
MSLGEKRHIHKIVMLAWWAILVDTLYMVTLTGEDSGFCRLRLKVVLPWFSMRTFAL